MMIIEADGHGEIAFGAMQAGLDLEYSRSVVHFTWEGFDEMDQVSGSGSAELQDDGSIEILAAGEADWRERAIRAAANLNVYRLLAQQAIHALYSMTVERNRLRVSLDRANEAYRALLVESRRQREAA